MIQGMLRFPEHTEVQKNGCGALRNLAFDADNAATVMQLGGAQVVLDAMRRHSGAPPVQQNGCGCVQNLASTSQHRAVLLSHGAVDAILAAMRRFPSEPLVQENSCGALANLASSRAPLERMLEEGAVEGAPHWHFLTCHLFSHTNLNFLVLWKTPSRQFTTTRKSRMSCRTRVGASV